MSNHDYILKEEMVASQCEKTSDGIKVTVGDEVFDFVRIGENLYRTMVDGRSYVVGAIQYDGTVYVDIDSRLIELQEPSEDGFAGGAGGMAGEKDKIFAPMPGKIVKLMVKVGDKIVEKQPMVIVEAMKMENQVNSRANGTVKAINFADGDQVDTESPIIELELESEE